MSAQTERPTSLPVDADRPLEEDDEELPMDEIFHLLQSHRRRLTLHYLRGTDGAVDMREVVEEVAAEEYDTTPEQLDSTRRQRVYISLYQRHLPKLDDAGIIVYDQDRGWVERTDRADVLDTFLLNEPDPVKGTNSGPTPALTTSHAHQWNLYYRYATVGCLVLIATAWFDLLPASLASDIALSSIIVGVFLGLVLAREVARRVSSEQ